MTGDVSTGLICVHCGALNAPAATAADESRALQRFHFLLGEGTFKDMDRALRNGFLPTHPPVLIDAGIHLAPMLEDHAHSTAAGERLKMIIARLKISPETPETSRALKELGALLRKHETSEAHNEKMGCLLISVLSILLAITGWFIVSSVMEYLNHPAPAVPVLPEKPAG